MQTFGQYVRDVLCQVTESYGTLAGLEDAPGDLAVIRRECARITGLLGSLARRIDAPGATSDVYAGLLKRCRYYIQNYDFNGEIETMSALYSEDPNRLRNMRLKILESLDDRRLMGEIFEAIEALDGT